MRDRRSMALCVRLVACVVGVWFSTGSLAAWSQQSDPASLLTAGTTSVNVSPGVGIPYQYALIASKAHGEQTRYDLGGDSNRVLLQNGSFVHEATDMRVPSRGLDFEFKRIYRSDISYNGPLGANWHHNFDQYLVKYRPLGGSGEEFIALRDGFGRAFAFKKEGNAYVGPTNLFATLTLNADGTFVLKRKDGVARTFRAPTVTAVGRLTRVEDESGNAITLGYTSDYSQLTSITDTLGRESVLAYYPTGRLKCVIDAFGRAWWYGYDVNDNLQAVVTPPPTGDPSSFGYVTTYGYIDCRIA